ncbi:Sugar (and other) transporter-like protein 68 [Elsinoe fawcettii]|nr:Sugar (and other) transporter-like protein 68 [Elsinoe fawcettii]
MDSSKASSISEEPKHAQTTQQHVEIASPSTTKQDKSDIDHAIRQGSVPHVGEKDAISIAKSASWEVDALISEMEASVKANPAKPSPFHINFSSPRTFTFVLVAFASMGGLLSGLDQSLISGANLFLPRDLHLSPQQNSLVNSGMPLGAVGGAIILSPCNEYFGRRWSILISCILYTIGAALEAGAINYGMIVTGRFILGFGVGLEGGTVPVYVAETVERRLRGNMVSLYQFNIALGEVLGYAVAAMFLKVKGNWRYILGSSLVFSTIMFAGMLVLPESPRYLMHKGRPVEAYQVWKRIRGVESLDSREEFFVMKNTTEEEQAVVAAGRQRRFPWMDLFTVPRARRAFVYCNIMIGLGQFTGINAVMYYLSVLMSQVGFNDIQANYMALVGGGSLLLGTIPAIFLMETCGRRFWACAMLPGFFIGLVLVGISYEMTSRAATLGTYLTGLILYELFFGSYATLTWVIPSESYPTYLRSYGMTTSAGWLFLSSFIVTYNFTAMQDAMTRPGLALGFYRGIAVLGWFYQLFFMPETKDKTLEEIDLIFEKPTTEIVRENMVNVKETTADLLAFRWKKVFITGHSKRRASMSG